MRRPSIPPFDTYREYFTKNWLEWFDSLDNDIKQTRLLLHSYIAHASLAHNDLTGIQGGAVGDNQHITSAELTDVQSVPGHIGDSTIHFTEASIDHTAISNIGTNSHSQIDTHISNTSNPHSVTANQVLPSQTGNAGKFITTDGTNVSWGTVTAGVSGSGTTNTIPLWAAGTTLGDSALTQNAGDVTCSGHFNIATGKVYKINSAQVLNAQSSNVFVGLVNNPSTGSANSTIVGYDSGKSGFSHNQDVFIGDGIGKNVTGGGANTVVGSLAGQDLTTAVSNVFVGALSGRSVTSGSNNILIGSLAGSNVTTSGNLIAIGRGSMASNVSGLGVIAIGATALQNSTASYNIGIGPETMLSTTTSPNNTALGYQAGYGISTGAGFNVSIGFGAGSAVTSTSDYGIHLGPLAGYRLSGGSGNVFIGGWTGYGAGSYSISRAIIIGNDCMRTVTPVGDRLYIDVTSGVGASTLIYGEFDNRYLKINGGFGTAVSIKTANYTATPADSSITLDGTSASVTITLPASPNIGQEFNFACIDSTNACEINPNGKSIYTDSTNFPLYSGENLKIKYDGTRWVGA